MCMDGIAGVFGEVRMVRFFRSTLLSRSNKVSQMSVCSSVCVYIRLFVHKLLFDFSEIWHVGRGQ